MGPNRWMINKRYFDEFHRTQLCWLALSLSMMILFVGTNVEAQAQKPPKRTTINFEDQLIEGRAQKPELFVLLQNRMNNSRRLFRLRENFLPEMRKSAEDLGRSETGMKTNGGSAK